MTQVAVAGATGRMGRQLIRAIQEHDHAALSFAFSSPLSPLLGQDAGVQAGVAPLDVFIQSAFPELSSPLYDVLIDFSHADITAKLVEQAVADQRALVIGTTGYDIATAELIQQSAREIPILVAANYSVGVNATLKLLEMAAKALGPSADIEVVEAHHKHKVDAPSGTALAMGEVMADALGKQLPADGVFSRVGQIGARESGSIGFSTIRGGDVVGEHTVYFLMNGERIEITHRAMDRMIFARGAVQAACWLAKQSAGLYSMDDVLDIA